MRLINILKDMTKRLDSNGDKNIEEIYENYDRDDDYKIVIKEDLSKSCIILCYIFIGGLFVTINLVSVFTIRSVMNSLFEIFKFSVKCFFYKQSDLEKYNLTDFTNRFNSSYNFYEQFFNDIYNNNNNVDFDLMMFWDFIGFFMCKYCGFKCTYIFFFILNSALLVLIGGFDFLDIDERTHKYSFLKLLYISLAYLFLWISVSSSALLSQQKLSDCFDALKKGLDNSHQIEEQKIEQDTNQNIKVSLNENKNKKCKCYMDDKIYFPFLISTISIAFIINYFINRIIFKYKDNFILRKTKFQKTDNVYHKIYTKEKYIFLLCVCIPYFGESIFSFILYLLFIKIFTKKIKRKEESSENFEIKSVSVKKICGYILINQTIVVKKEIEEIKERVENKEEEEKTEERVEREEREESEDRKEKKEKKERLERLERKERVEREKRFEGEVPKNENSCLILKYIKKCLNCFKLLIITIKDCFKNSFCFICNCKQ